MCSGAKGRTVYRNGAIHRSSLDLGMGGMHGLVARQAEAGLPHRGQGDRVQLIGEAPLVERVEPTVHPVTVTLAWLVTSPALQKLENSPPGAWVPQVG